MVSLISQPLVSIKQQQASKIARNNFVDFSNHQQYDYGNGWKNTLNNLRLTLQPILVLWLIFPGLDVFPDSHLLLRFNHLINQYQPFSSA